MEDRVLRPISSRCKSKIIFEGREYIDFSSNDYLGLANHPKLLAAATDAQERFGTSSSASRLLSGDLSIHHQLEDAVARFKKKEAALTFNSGYQANIGIISSLYTKGDAIFSDRLSHASIIDGIILSQARSFRFVHNDLGNLESLLKRKRRKFKRALIATETIFSMDGDRPDLKALVDLKDRYNCQLFVDEAHATGIYGPDGSGVVEEESLSDRVDFIMGTFSKALGSFGAYLASSKKVVGHLVNRCRSFIYSTALPPSVAACNLAAIDLVKEEPNRRQALLALTKYFRNTLETEGFRIESSSQIVPLIIGDDEKTLRSGEALRQKGYWVLPIRPPTVPKNEARLRFSLTFNHNRETLKQVIDDIAKIGI